MAAMQRGILTFFPSALLKTSPSTSSPLLQAHRDPFCSGLPVVVHRGGKNVTERRETASFVFEEGTLIDQSVQDCQETQTCGRYWLGRAEGGKGLGSVTVETVYRGLAQVLVEI